MCDISTIAGLVLSVGSAAMASSAQNQAQKARNQAMQNERVRQAGLQREQNAVQADSERRYEGFEEGQDKTADELSQLATKNVADVAAPGTGAAGEANVSTQLPTSNNTLVQAEQATQGAKTKAQLDEQAMRLGKVRAFGDYLGDVGAGVARDQGKLNQIAGFRQGSTGANAFEMEAASQAGGNAKMFSDLMGLGAGALTSYGAKSGGGLATFFDGGLSGIKTNISSALGGRPGLPSVPKAPSSSASLIGGLY